MTRLVVRGRWVLAGEGDRAALRENLHVVIEDDKIADIVAERPGSADQWLELDQGLVLPGFVNLHNHAFSAPLFRGITEDVSEADIGGNIIYSMLMPMGALAVKVLDREAIADVARLAILQLLKTGTTTNVDIWRLDQAVFLDVAREMGLRVYGCPYLFSTPDLGVDAAGKPTYAASGPVDTGFERTVALFEREDEGPRGRIRIGFGPHGLDSCTPELLQQVHAKARELGTVMGVHCAQSKPELEVIRQRYGKTPVEHARDIGILSPHTILGHCVYATDADLAIIRDHGAAIGSCPLTFARSGKAVPYERFRAAGVRVGFGTDGYCLDIVNDIRAAGALAKVRTGDGARYGAHELIRAGTQAGAAALSRPDLGALAPGLKADLVVFDMARPHLQPVFDPVITLLWHGSGLDLSASIIDGEIVVRDGRSTRVDEARVTERGAAQIERVWAAARSAGFLRGRRTVA